MPLTYKNYFLEDLLNNSEFKKSYNFFIDSVNEWLKNLALNNGEYLQSNYGSLLVNGLINSNDRSALDHLPILYSCFINGESRGKKTFDNGVAFIDFLTNSKIYIEYFENFFTITTDPTIKIIEFMRSLKLYSGHNYFKSYEYFYSKLNFNSVDFYSLYEFEYLNSVKVIEEFIEFRCKALKEITKNKQKRVQADYTRPCKTLLKYRLLTVDGIAVEDLLVDFTRHLYHFRGHQEYVIFRILESLSDGEELTVFINNFLKLIKDKDSLAPIKVEERIDVKRLMKVYSSHMPLEWALELISEASYVEE